ncbi:SDR family NAD(P)-dependent oxidoreductase [Rhodococcus opacus]|uniref:SDR family NAD(P)-dependent oxidoreductase n=1 Tax=Rhodococcus opacus TaxID=37919 RepID=A0AAX3YPK4_RHOOP|nr:SDR family oxidoreductase [Rhodococcus opacus]MCZ4587613.1 SDR family NAD(P)-dependent oxidoreductase [Rhodococcus opacus]WLF51392.1 SDR family oxidoreductase [Rhodococcus opacus]
MTLALSGKSALIIGGAGGIGGAGARALLAAGASVTIMSRDTGRISAFADELAQQAPQGAQVDYIAGDCLVESDVVAAVARAGGDRGLDICVSTVGLGVVTPLLLNNADDFTAQLRINITSAFVAIKACVPAMAAAGGGAMVFTSSVAATRTFRYMSGYCAGKAGLEALVCTAADEFGHLGIRINCISPGLVNSPDNVKVQAHFTGDRPTAFLDETPLGRLGAPADIAGAIRFLAGPESSWVTGTSITVDGGIHLRRTPDIAQRLRDEYGDQTVDALLAGQLPANAPA